MYFLHTPVIDVFLSFIECMNYTNFLKMLTYNKNSLVKLLILVLMYLNFFYMFCFVYIIKFQKMIEYSKSHYNFCQIYYSNTKYKKQLEFFKYVFIYQKTVYTFFSYESYLKNSKILLKYWC